MKTLFALVLLFAIPRAEAQTVSGLDSNPSGTPDSAQISLNWNSLPLPSVRPEFAIGPYLNGNKNEKPKTPKRIWIPLSLAAYTMSALDMHATEEGYQDFLYRFDHFPSKPGAHFTESDPFARPLIKLPEPAYYAVGFALTTGVNWLGWRMGRARRFHKIWWLPQSISISGKTYGYRSHFQSLK